MAIKHLTKTWQSDGAACGQYSIAMATGEAFEDVVKAVGHRSGMSINGIKQTLSKLGYTASNGDATIRGMEEARGIVIIESRCRSNGHAMAFEGDAIYDPDDFPYENLAHVERHIAEKGWEITEMWRVEPVKVREWAVGSAK